MFNYHNFDDVFDFDPDWSYASDTVQELTANRKTIEGLFIDQVLKLLQIKRPQKYYPPKSNSDLRNLHKAVCENTGPDHHKLSVLYYILLDYDSPTGRRDASTSFEKRSFLPQKYQIYMKGLWHMDHLQFEPALQYLTHPSLIATFPDKTLEVLVRQKPDDLSLALAYYHTVQPTLTDKSAIECLFSALARTSVSEAFYFLRAQTADTQRHMLEMLIALVLNDSRKAQAADRAVELVGLPMGQQEEEWFEEYLLRGEGRRLHNARDTVLMRRIGTGRLKEGVQMKGLEGKTVGGVNWATLVAGVERGLGPRVDF